VARLATTMVCRPAAAELSAVAESRSVREKENRRARSERTANIAQSIDGREQSEQAGIETAEGDLSGGKVREVLFELIFGRHSRWQGSD